MELLTTTLVFKYTPPRLNPTLACRKKLCLCLPLRLSLPTSRVVPIAGCPRIDTCLCPASSRLHLRMPSCLHWPPISNAAALSSAAFASIGIICFWILASLSLPPPTLLLKPPLPAATCLCLCHCPCHTRSVATRLAHKSTPLPTRTPHCLCLMGRSYQDVLYRAFACA
jgi:hypothetical protein